MAVYLAVYSDRLTVFSVNHFRYLVAVTSTYRGTGQKNDIVQPKTDKWFSFPSHFSSFFAV